MSKIIKKNNIIYHLAGISDLNKAYKDPLGTAELNLLATVRILNFCVLYHIDKFIFASSVYANSNFGGFIRLVRLPVKLIFKNFQKSII